MDSENTQPQTSSPDDDVSDEELAAALALIKKRRADEARQREQQSQQQHSQQQIAAVPVPRPSAPAVSPTTGTAAAIWPPAPTNSPMLRGGIPSPGQSALMPPELPSPFLGDCPSCKRKLLTRTSALCNWCGAKINNPDYQEQAARTRQEMDDAIRQTAELRAQDAPNRTVLGRLKRRLKPGGTSAPQT